MIIVTGGAGFIGSVILWQLNAMGIDDIVVVDEMSTGEKWKNIAKRSISAVYHKDDFLKNLERFSREGLLAVIHMGACSTTTERDVDFLVRNNFNYSQELFKFCTEGSVPFLYASSAATYGGGEHGFDDAAKRSLLPINGYGYSKYLFDVWAEKQRKTPPFWAGFKFFNVYGPNEYHKGAQASVIYHAFPQVRDHGSLKLFKSYRPEFPHGGQRRDFIYVKDVARVVGHFLEHRQRITSGIYNVGTGASRTFEDLGRSVFRAMDREAKFEWIEMPENMRNQYQYFTEASVEKLRTHGQFRQEFTSLEEGARDYVQNYLTKEDPFL